ncbi:MAG: hypothetical protein NVS2B7_40590 [Herpetosiphon sp.]
MTSSATDEGFESALHGDLAVLHSLAQAGWMNTQQLQALCFPGYSVMAVRTRLHYLEEATWIGHVRWRLGPSAGGQTWSITRRGRLVVERYLPVDIQWQACESGRPTTALERAEWRIGLAIRDLVVRLILAARRSALVCTLSVQIPPRVCPAELDNPCPQPDFELIIEWQPPVLKPNTWLPWLETARMATSAVCYAVYIDRAMALSPLTWPARITAVSSSASAKVPILVTSNADRHTFLKQQNSSSDQRGMCLINWSELEHGLLQGQWRDDAARPRSYELNCVPGRCDMLSHTNE